METDFKNCWTEKSDQKDKASIGSFSTMCHINYHYIAQLSQNRKHYGKQDLSETSSLELEHLGGNSTAFPVSINKFNSIAFPNCNPECDIVLSFKL